MTIEHFNYAPDEACVPRNTGPADGHLPLVILIPFRIPGWNLKPSPPSGPCPAIPAYSRQKNVKTASACLFTNSALHLFPALQTYTSHSQGVHKPFTSLHKAFTNQYKALQAFTNHHKPIPPHSRHTPVRTNMNQYAPIPPMRATLPPLHSLETCIILKPCEQHRENLRSPVTRTLLSALKIVIFRNFEKI